MTTPPPPHNATESEFLSALRQRWPNLLRIPATPEEREEWKWFAEYHKPRGLKREKDVAAALAHAENLVTEERIEPRQAVSRAITETGLRYPPNYKSDEKAWERRFAQLLRDTPQHTHKLIDANSVYDVEHAVYAVMCRLPEITAAIFITTNTDRRKRIIRAVF